tara:strand:+ start:547 stop:657 length:111 start_codon:yes stop_codon:yes gene_type:complete
MDVQNIVHNHTREDIDPLVVGVILQQEVGLKNEEEK